MALSNNILEQLSIITTNGQKSVLSLLQHTHSAIGRRDLRERILRPITAVDELEKRWAEVAYASELPNQRRVALERDLKGLYDIPRLHYTFAEASTGSLDILQLAQSYCATVCLIQNLRDTPLACPELLETQIAEFRRMFRSLFDEEKAQRKENGEPIGFLTAMSGPRTMAIEKKIQDIQETWAQTWAVFCKEIKIPAESFSLVLKGDGEFAWEGSRTLLKTVQGAVFSKAGGLTALAVDYKKSGPITISCKELYVFVDSVRTLSRDLAIMLRQESRPACDTMWEAAVPFQKEWFSWLGRIDSTIALAVTARMYGWTRPSAEGEAHLEIVGLVHPLLYTAQTRMEYVKHNVSLGSTKAKGWLIYGVNASGKSSLMKAVGIATILAQAGSFVPAESMRIRPYDAAFSRIWSHDNLWAGLSSFAVEISELRDILAQATDRSLVLGDEVCSGTESMSATALVASTLEHLDEKGCHFMFATHLHDLMKVPRLLPRPGIAVWHLRVQRTPEGKLIYDRTLQAGSGSCTYGLEVARAMGIPLKLLDRAHEIRRALGGEVAATDAPKSLWNPNIQRKACEVCGDPIVKELEVHHILPRAEGGSNELRNLVVLCERCHDKHHAGQLEVGELRQTSEGLERSTTVFSEVAAPVKKKAPKWTEEQMETIRTAINKFSGRPLTRICLELEEVGIHIKPAQLKGLI